MSRRVVRLVMVLSVAALAGWGQENSDQEILGVLVPRSNQEALNRLELSKSRANYPVTPGDLYILGYRSAGKDVSNEILVESDYNLNLNVFGKIKGEGLTFPELKLKVEKIINDAYPNSLPYLSIKAVGMFQVYLTGEVQKTQFLTAWGLSRLSEVVLPFLSEDSSIRRVVVEAVARPPKTYDLYKAVYKGAIEEDPFVRVGDTIIIGRRDRRIELQGQVSRPGKYQILPQENLKEAIEYYGGGFTALADREHCRILRIRGENPETLHLDLRQVDQETAQLEDEDVLTVPSRIDNLPTVSFEGAVVSRAASPASADLSAPVNPAVNPGQRYGWITHAFAAGETLRDALFVVRDSIAPSADLRSAYLVRKEGRIVPLDLSDPGNDILLQPGDRMILPAVPEILIPVTGGVYKPGTYPFVPGKTSEHYIALAGGINPELNGGNSVSIRDARGHRRSRKLPIQAGDTVYVRTNDFLYNFNRYFPAISSSAALITAVLTIITYAQR